MNRLPLLRFADLVVGYSRKGLTQPMTGAVLPGELVLVSGPNGQGKTTFVRTLVGLLPPVSGSIERTPGVSVAYVPQGHGLDPAFPVTVRDVVGLGLRRSGRGDRVNEALDAVGLAPMASRRFSRISGGQQRRTLVARGLAHRADLLVLDEPTAGVDREGAFALWTLLRDLAVGGRGLLVVSHDEVLGQRLAHRTLLLPGAAA